MPAAATHGAKLGVLIPSVGRIIEDTPRSWSHLSELAQAAEEAGFDSVWVDDNLSGWDERPGSWEAVSLLAGLAAATSTIGIGSFVFRTINRNPVILAKTAETIHEISNGRFTIGLGVGQGRTERLGIPSDHPVGRVEEAVQIVHQLLKTGHCDFHGKYYQVEDYTLNPRWAGGNPPKILIGAKKPRMMGLAAKYADNWNDFIYYDENTPEHLAPIKDRFDSVCRQVGRDPDSIEKSVLVAISTSSLDEKLRQFFIDEGFAEPISGTPEQVATSLRAFFDLGISEIQMLPLEDSPEGILALKTTVSMLAEM